VAIPRHQHHVLDPTPPQPGMLDSRLYGEHHPSLSTVLERAAMVGASVDLETDPVACGVAELCSMAGVSIVDRAARSTTAQSIPGPAA